MDTISSSFLVIVFLGINYSSSDILHRQKRTWIIDTFQIEEEYSGTFPYVLGKIELENKFALLKLHGQGVDEDPMGKLQIDENTGVVSVLDKLDYEKNTKLTLQFEAYDKIKNVIDTKLSVEVQILDINDNIPTFDSPSYTVHLKESATQGSYVIVVHAKDLDSGTTNNGTFNLRIVSVFPEPSGVEFFMEQNGPYGNISFRGCLDYEKAKRYTILVEAKDRGEKVQLSSTCTVVVNIDDENNHLPIFTGPTHTATLKERAVDVEVLRMQVMDRDTKGTDAWKANYIIHGKSGDNFRIDTIPETNEGVLYVTKPLDYEDQSVLNLTITVENLGKYFSCKVVSKAVSSNGLWNVMKTTGKDQLSTRIVIVNVEDVNDPPIFKPNNKTVMVYEDIALGYNLGNMTAIDRDMSHGNKIQYAKGADPGDWVTVDPNTGVITTVKTLDRESSLVKDNIYTVTVFAIDDGKPLATGTGTLLIRLRDRNDNVPQLATNSFGICISDAIEHSQANLSAFDLDEVPFAGPFYFKLHGDVKNKWRIDPENGYSVNLIREDKVHAGHHELLLEVSDQQGYSALHNLSVLVCECKASEMGDMPSCLSRQVSRSVGFRGASPILFFAILLLLGILLLSLLLSCKRQVIFMPDEGTEQNLIPSNTEHPGSDCKFQAADSETDVFQKPNTSFLGTHNSLRSTNTSFRETSNGLTSTNSFIRKAHNGSTRRNSFIRRAHNGSTRRNTSFRGTHNGLTGTNSEHYAAWDGEDYLEHRKFLQHFLERRFTILQAPAEELGDYAPHLYAEEGHPDSSPQLDPIPIQEIPFDPDMLQYLDPKFNKLASLCSPEDTFS